MLEGYGLLDLLEEVVHPRYDRLGLALQEARLARRARSGIPASELRSG